MKSEGGFRKNMFAQSGEEAYNPIVSIITVVFNNREHIEKTILSVLSQSCKDKEYLVIDGGSTDGTLDIIRKYDQKIDYWQSEPDRGIYDAMNKGLHLAKGKYVLFLNSGDLFSDNEVLAKVFSSAFPTADVYYGETNLMDANGKILGTRTNLSTRKLPEKLTWKKMKWGMLVSHQSVFVRKSLAPDFDLSYQCSSDIDWVIESLKRSKEIVNTGLIISNYLTGGFSVRHQKKSWKERFLIYRKHFGWMKTLGAHAAIILKNLIHKAAGKKNY